MTDNSKIISELNGLVEKCCDGVTGYKNAAENSNSVSLKNFFHAKSNQRDRFASELKSEIRRMGGEVKDTDGSAMGTMHRTWMDIKSAFSTNVEETVLDACENGEESIIEDYDHVLNAHTLNANTRNVLQSQRNEIARTKRTIESLEEAYD